MYVRNNGYTCKSTLHCNPGQHDLHDCENLKFHNVYFISYHPGTHDMTCYNVVACESRASVLLRPSILSPELSLPVVPSCFVTRSQAALHLLSCLDTLTQAQDHRFTVREDSEDRQAGCGKVYSREDFSAVTRFESEL